MWRSITSLFQANQPARASLALVEAYKAVFTRSQHGEMVLADLATYSGFYAVGEYPDPDRLMYQEGMRAVYARIHQHLSLPSERRKELEEAVRREGWPQEGINA